MPVMFGGAPRLYAGVHGWEAVVSAFFDRALPRRSPDARVSEPDDQVSFRLSDARVERRELAKKRASKSRTGERRD